MTAAILAGGTIRATSRLKTLVQEADLIVAADGGLRHAEPLGIKPHIIVGDFDSANTKDLEKFADVPKKVFPPDKNELDLELALSYALEQGTTRLYLLGVLGGRFDQTLAALFIAAKHASGVEVSLHAGVEAVYLLSGPTTKIVQAPPNQRFSLLSLCDASVVSLQGARYNLEHHTLPFGVGLGVSNEITTPPLSVTVHSGLCALILEHRERP